MKIKSANELYEISKTQAPILVEEVLDGVKEHCIKKCEEKAINEGGTYYSIYLKQTYGFVKELLLKKCIELVKEFEENDYKISIDDSGNGYYVNFIITFSWNGAVQGRSRKTFGGNQHLYDTDNGVINEDTENYDVG